MAKYQKKPADEKFAKGLTLRKEFTEATLEIEPGQSRSMPLGQYDGASPDPVFDVIIDPATEDDMIGRSLDKFDYSAMTQCYLLHYMFQNYGSKNCKITVRLKDVSSEENKDCEGVS